MQNRIIQLLVNLKTGLEKKHQDSPNTTQQKSPTTKKATSSNEY